MLGASLAGNRHVIQLWDSANDRAFASSDY